MKIFLLILFGALGGVVGGMGMGGGTILIPLLTLFLSIPQHTAQAINLISFIPMSIVCLVIHSKNGLVEYKKSWIVVLIAVLGAVGGAFLSKHISGKLLSKILGIFLALLGLIQIFVFFSKKNKNKH